MTIRAYLHDRHGRCVHETRVHEFAPEFIDYDGTRFMLVELTSALARYAEPASAA